MKAFYGTVQEKLYGLEQQLYQSSYLHPVPTSKSLNDDDDYKDQNSNKTTSYSDSNHIHRCNAKSDSSSLLAGANCCDCILCCIHCLDFCSNCLICLAIFVPNN